MDRHRGDRIGDGGKYSRMPSRWPSDSQPNQHQRYPRGGGIAVGGEGFSGGRYHPYRGQLDYSSAGGQGFRDGHGDLGGHQMPMSGQKRGFAGRGSSPDYSEGNKFTKLFIGSVPKTVTEEDIRPLFEEHGDVLEVALIKDWRTGYQQGFGFIKYASSEHADRAIRALHNRFTLPGATGPIQVKFADERDWFGTSEDKLFVASLNRRANEKEVEEIFAVYGHVEDVYLMKDEMKQSRGCGFVKFSNKDMALAAMNALHGTFVMRGCDQPLIVRFAEPKRPRPFDQRNAPTFGGPGFGPQSDAVILNRQPENLDEPRGGRIPNTGRPPLSPQSGGLPSQSSTQGFGSQTAVMGGTAATMVVGSGSFGDAAPPTNGTFPSLAPISSSQSFNSPVVQAPPAIGQQILPLQKSLPLPQNLPPALPLHNALLSFSNTQTQALQGPMQQLLQFQLPQSIGFNSFSQAQQVPGLSAQLSASPRPTLQNATAATLQNPNQQLGQQQGLPAVPNQQQLPPSNISQQLLQQSGHQLPSQMLLQQQAQSLQSSYQSSQQAIFQIQQQLQMMQHSNISQQQNSQSAKQQLPWSGPPATSTAPASIHGTALPSTIPATPSHALSDPSVVVASTCNWTEHTSPEGFKYYYNSTTRESKWEKPEELTVFEQQQQQKLLLMQQQQLLLQQQKIAAPQLKSPSHTPQIQVQTQVQPIQLMLQTQVQPQMQPRLQAQSQIPPSSLAYQASGVAGHQTVQDLSNPQLHGAGSGVQVSQEWAWKNKPTGS